jgi:methionyl-tRNA synthetase
MSWGIAVPGDDTQVMYVWFDALTNYISTLGWPCSAEATQGKPYCLFDKFWTNGEVVQMAGKDQVRFQSIMWQAMLMSADIKNTDKVIYHGFITSGGQKMSKSLGNVIEPMAIVDAYGADALRIFLTRHIHPFEDTDVTMEKFKESYNADLANGIGNLAARITTLGQANLDAPIERPEADSFTKEYSDALERYDYNAACDHIWDRIKMLDGRLTTEKPFAVVKEDKEKGKEMIVECLTELYLIARLLQPFMPKTSDAIKTAIRANKKPENLFPRKE